MARHLPLLRWPLLLALGLLLALALASCGDTADTSGDDLDANATPGALPEAGGELAATSEMTGTQGITDTAPSAGDVLTDTLPEGVEAITTTVPGAGDNTLAGPVEVMLTEFAVELPGTELPAGLTVFKVTNGGTMAHNLVVEGNGIEESFDTDLAPGETRELSVDLVPGTYRLYCPVGDHAERGMEVELTVQESQ